MNLEEFKQKLLENPEVKKVFDDKTDLFFEISEMVEEARVRGGLTQAQLAKRVGTKQPSIARIESGVALPRLSFLKKIAEALGTYLIPPKFASEELLILDTSKWKIGKTSTNSGQKSIEQLINQ